MILRVLMNHLDGMIGMLVDEVNKDSDEDSQNNQEAWFGDALVETRKVMVHDHHDTEQDEKRGQD